MENGKPKEACEKFEASNKVEASAGTLLNMGRCLEAQGKTASALAMYKETITVGKAQNKARHVEAAEQFITDLEPRLSRLTIDAIDPVDGLSILRTDSEGRSVSVAENERGVGVAVDPSTYTVEATAPGHDKWSKTVEVNKAATVTVTVPSLAKRGNAGTHEPPSHWKPDAFFIAGAATAGVGIVGIAVGSAFGAMTLSDVNTATSNPKLCPHYACTPLGQSWMNDVNSEATVSTVTLTLGIAAAAAGGTLVAWSFLHHDTSKPAPTAVVMPIIAPGPAPFVGLTVRGAM